MRARPRTTALVLSLVVAGALLVATAHETSAFRGMVVDGDTGEPLERAVVVVVWHRRRPRRAGFAHRSRQSHRTAHRFARRVLGERLAPTPVARIQETRGHDIQARLPHPDRRDLRPPHTTVRGADHQAEEDPDTRGGPATLQYDAVPLSIGFPSSRFLRARGSAAQSDAHPQGREQDLRRVSRRPVPRRGRPVKLAAARCVVVLVVVGMALLTTHGTAMGDAGEANKQLVAAARAGDAEAVRRLLAPGADPNTVDRITALMAASTRFEKGQRLDIMRQLLAAGARVNDQADTGETALTFAARFRDADAIQLLLDNGADPNIVNQSGISPLLEAMRWGASKQEQLEMVQRLLARGANPNARGTGVGTPLSWAVRQNSLALVRLLLDHPADPTPPAPLPPTPLVRPVSRQNLGPDSGVIVQILVDAGADVNARDPFGDTPYSIAASTGNL